MLSPGEYRIDIWHKYVVYNVCHINHAGDNDGRDCGTHDEFEPVTEPLESLAITSGSAEIVKGNCSSTLCFTVTTTTEFRLELGFEDSSLDDAWMWSWIEPPG